MLSGRAFTWHDVPDGTHVQEVGVTEDGKYDSLTEDPQPAMFLPILQWPSSQTWLVVRVSVESRTTAPTRPVRSKRDPRQLALAIKEHAAATGLLLGVLASRVLAFICVSGNSPRSADTDWRCCCGVVAEAIGYVDFSATHAIARSYDTATRGVNWLH